MRYPIEVGRGRIAFTTALSFVLVVITASVGLADGPGSISGTVFNDIVGDGLADGAIGSAANPGESGIAVYVFKDDGTTANSPDGGDTAVTGSPVTTDASGDFTITGLNDGTFWVAVDSKSFTTGWPDQTYGPTDSVTPSGFSGSAGSVYSGAGATSSDGVADSGAANDAEHVARVVVSGGGAVVSIDFGFSRNVVTNTTGGDSTDHDVAADRTVQGSLRQFISNANSQTGANTMRFVPVTATNASGGGGSWHQITVTSQLPDITDGDTTVDGSVFSSSDGTTVLNPNSGSLGEAISTPGFTVGVDGIAFGALARPDFEILAGGSGFSRVDTGINISGADDVTIGDLAIRNFEDESIHTETAADRVHIHDVLVGSSPDVLSDPGASLRTGMGIEANGGSDGLIENSIMACSSGECRLMI